MNTARLRPSQPQPPCKHATCPSWLYSLLGALAVAWVGVLVLRPRDGSLIEPDPVDVKDYFSTDDIVRARSFGRPQLALQAAGSVARVSVLAFFLRRPIRPAPRDRPLLQASVAGICMSGSSMLATLPLRALMRRRSLAVGLATGSWGKWSVDLAKSTTIELIVGAGSSAGVLWLMRRYPRAWWLIGAGVSVAGAVGLTFVAPVALDPLFNRFTVLAEGPLREQVLGLAKRAGVEVGEVYEVDASTRTSAANAYVTGFGATKRVVLFDTLIESFTPAETRLVVAHELAHVRHRDIQRGIAQMALSAPGAMYATSRLLRELRSSERTPPSAQTLPAVALALGVVAIALGPASMALSRRVESRADAFALELTGEAEPFIAFEQRIVRQNLADPDPPRWLQRLTASHPSALQRIGIALAYDSRR
jgi:STE24 endopeptidase